MRRLKCLAYALVFAASLIGAFDSAKEQEGPRVPFMAREFESELRIIPRKLVDPDSKAETLQALRLDVDEVYPHCPRAFRFSRLWDTDFISRNATEKSERYWYQRWANAMKTP